MDIYHLIEVILTIAKGNYTLNTTESDEAVAAIDKSAQSAKIDIFLNNITLNKN